MNNFRTATIDQFLSDGDIEALSDTLNAMSPSELYDLLTTSDEDAPFLFNTLSISLAQKTFALLPDNLQIKMLQGIPQSRAVSLLKSLMPGERIKIIEELPRDIIDDLIKHLSHEEKLLVLTYLGYPEGTVGRLMTPYYVPVQMDWTVEEVFAHIKGFGQDSENLDYIYVVDDEGKLLDDIRLRKLLFVPKETRIENVSDRIFVSLSVYEKDEAAINVFRKYERVALPVIDEEGIMLGIVSIKDILKLSNEAATEDIQKIGGMGVLEEPYIDAPFFELIKKRSGWLVILFVGEGLTTTVMGYFEDEIARAVILALFIPLIVSSGGNAGSQASTLIIRSLALGEIKLKDWWRIVKREVFSGIALGSILGMIGFLRVVAWGAFSKAYGEHWIMIGFTVAFSLLGVVLFGTLTGATFPLILRSIGIDPALSSAPFIATVVDVMGIVIYFLLAIAILSGTLL